jgi:hypothetical protein
MTPPSQEGYKQKGKQLPPSLRPHAKLTYLIRDSDGIHLYDEAWNFMTTIKVAAQTNFSATDAFGKAAVTPVPRQAVLESPDPVPIAAEPPLAGKALSRQVQRVLDRFQHAINLHGIRADYFLEHRMGPFWRDRWERIWLGDLSPLLEDTQEFAAGTVIRTQDKGGLGILKAALVHELYVNSTLAGRSNGEKEGESGRNMLNLLLFVCLLSPLGDLDHVGPILSEEDQMRLIDTLAGLAGQMGDKRGMLQRVHQKLVFDFKRGRDWPEKSTAAAVKSALIFKLYENTNRLDRGDGTDMVRIVRTLIESRITEE